MKFGREAACGSDRTPTVVVEAAGQKAALL
jgi:hypothetical protein